MKSIRVVPFIFSFMFFGCQSIIECVINKRPEIPDTSFEVGNIGYYYDQELTSEVKNSPNDDDYDYFYDIVGDLPNGLKMYSDFRTLSIKGMPLASGSFTFTILLTVDPPEYYDEDSGEYEDTMCSTSTSKEFTIIIN